MSMMSWNMLRKKKNNNNKKGLYCASEHTVFFRLPPYTLHLNTPIAIFCSILMPAMSSTWYSLSLSLSDTHAQQTNP
jgi:hypothetical protein